MRELRIKKGRGRHRVVVVPSRDERSALRVLVPRLAAAAMALDRHGVQHGFTPGRSPVTCARAHVGYRWTLSCDLVDCFDRIAEAQVRALVPDVDSRCFVGGVARQGLPTSPAICNIALSGLDAEIVSALAGRGVYTRYADDLVVSTNDIAVIHEMRDVIERAARGHGHEVHERKTTIQDGRRGRRIVVGIAVGDDAIYPTREARRALRAAEHAAQTRGSDRARDRARGMRAWASLRGPDILAAATRAAETGEHVLAHMIVTREVT
jgi:hypothetical protein